MSWLSSLFGGSKKPSTAGRGNYYSYEYQNMLPEFLRGLGGNNAPGGKNLAELWRNPGGISPTLGASIAPIMAQESDRIARSNQGQLANAAGGAARSNTGGTGIAQALQAAINRASQRDVAGARREAIGKSEMLRRADLQQYLDTHFNILNLFQQQRANRMGQGAAQQQANSQKQAATLGAYASIIGAFASNSNNKTSVQAVPAFNLYSSDYSIYSDQKAKEGIVGAAEDEILRKLVDLPISTWKYKSHVEPEQPTHIGPMAQDFYKAFGLGKTDKEIAVVDAVGVLTAAVKALARKVA